MWGTLIDREQIQAVSVHFACTISGKDKNTHLLWSRYGVQKVVGLTCQIFSVLCMHEAINIQTPLDGRPLDLKHPVLDILSKVGLVRFVQMYTTSPHCHFSAQVLHPVTGLIVLCNLQHHRTKETMLNAANNYINHVRDMCQKMVGQLKSRLEYVAVFNDSTGIPLHYSAENYINTLALESLLSKYPVMLPFQTYGENNLVGILKEILEYVHSSLSGLLHDSANKGGFVPSWQAYQLELAFEELAFGHPLSVFDRPYSASLGTCSVNPRSVTHRRGFLGLAPTNSAAVGENPLPIKTWSGNQQLALRVARLFPLTDMLEAPPCIIGAEMVRLVLRDLYNTSSVPFYALQGEKLPLGFSLTGSITLESLAEQLGKVYNFSFPHTFNEGKRIVGEAGHDVVECLKMGLVELKLKFFPLLRTKDRSERYCARRAENLYLAVHPSTATPPLEATLASLTGDICLEIERRRLSYARNMEFYRLYGMPWLQAVSKRLPPLSVPDRLKMLVFISCVGLRMNGEFIDYVQLRELAEEMPLPQSELQKRLILGRDLMEKVTALKLWKLHSSIDFRVNKRQVVKPAGQAVPQKEAERAPEEIVEIEDQISDVPGLKSVSMVLSRDVRLKWTPIEMEWLSCETTKTHREAYQEYVHACQASLMQVRTFLSFRKKRREIMKAQGTD